jgi:hypothetical protein
MGDEQLKLYRALSRAPFAKSYVGKVFFTAFLGTHVPLLALLFYFVRHRRFGLWGALRILSVTVPATLGGDSVYALGDVRTLRAHGACLQGPETLPRQR